MGVHGWYKVAYTEEAEILNSDMKGSTTAGLPNYRLKS